MVKTSVAREVGYRREYRAGADFDFGIRMGLRGRLYFVNEFTAVYRNTADSVGRGAGAKSDDSAYFAMHILSGLLKAYPDHKEDIVEMLIGVAPMSVRMPPIQAG